MLVRQLFGVEFDRQSGALDGIEHPRGLRGAETDAFAKGIDRVGEAQPRDLGQHLVDQHRDIAVGVVGIFGRQGVGAEEGGGDMDAALAAESARGAQHADFAGSIETIARFDLDRRDPLGDQRIEPGQGARDEFALARPRGSRASSTRSRPRRAR
jgi:hypothetical protein